MINVKFLFKHSNSKISDKQCSDDKKLSGLNPQNLFSADAVSFS